MLIMLHIDDLLLFTQELMGHESFKKAVADHYLGEEHTGQPVSLADVLSEAAHD